MSKFLRTYTLEWMETKLKWKVGLVRLLPTSMTVLTKSGGVILTKTNFEMNLFKLDGDGKDDEDYQPGKEYVEPSSSPDNS